MIEPGLYHMLFISTTLFFIGVYGFFTRRNLVTMLMSIELILNSVNLNFIAFNKYLWYDKMDGLFFTIFIIAIAAAEAAVAIAIIINLYRSHKSIDVENAEEILNAKRNLHSTYSPAATGRILNARNIWKKIFQEYIGHYRNNIIIGFNCTGFVYRLWIFL